MRWLDKQQSIFKRATNIIKAKSIIRKIEIALQSNNSHFNLIKDDDKTALNRSDLQLILSLLNK